MVLSRAPTTWPEGEEVIYSEDPDYIEPPKKVKAAKAAPRAPKKEVALAELVLALDLPASDLADRARALATEILANSY